jgi:hypothetical protein
VIKGLQSGDGWVKADIWSVGCTCIEILTGTNPWPKFPNPMAAMYRIASGERPPLSTPGGSNPKIYGQNAESFVDVCCRQDPLERPSAAQLLNFHPLLASAREMAKAAGTLIPSTSNHKKGGGKSSGDIKPDAPLTSPLITAPLARPGSKHIMFDMKEENTKERGLLKKTLIENEIDDNVDEEDGDGDEEFDEEGTGSFDSAGFQTVGSVDSDYGWEGHPLWRHLSGREISGSSIKEEYYDDDEQEHRYEDSDSGGIDPLDDPVAHPYRGRTIEIAPPVIFEPDIDEGIYEPSFPPPISVVEEDDELIPEEPAEPLYEVPDSVTVDKVVGAIVHDPPLQTSASIRKDPGHRLLGISTITDQTNGVDANIFPMFSPLAAPINTAAAVDIDIKNRAGSNGRSERGNSSGRHDKSVNNSRGSDISNGDSESSFGNFAAVPLRVNEPINNQNGSALRDIWGSPPMVSLPVDDHHHAELGFGNVDAVERPRGAAAGESTRSKTKRRNNDKSASDQVVSSSLQSMTISNERKPSKSLVNLDRNEGGNVNNITSKSRHRSKEVGSSGDREGAKSVPPVDFSARPSHPIETKRGAGGGYPSVSVYTHHLPCTLSAFLEKHVPCSFVFFL